MGKDSDFYKNKTRQQKMKLRHLLMELPSPARDYLYTKEVSTQPSTLVQYAYDLLTFFTFLLDYFPELKEKDIRDLSAKDLAICTSDDMVSFQRYLELNPDPKNYHESGKKGIARRMAPLRGLYKYLFQRDLISNNPLDLVPIPRVKKDKNIIRMNAGEVHSILSAIENGTSQMTERQKKFAQKTRNRDLAILTLMLNTGIRVSECNGLDVTDIDLKADSMVIVRKGGGQDVLYFDEAVHDALETYLLTERKTIEPREGEEKALFLSLQGKRISVDAIENLVKKYAKMVVPNKKITPHKLRSTYGTALYRETGDIRLVADVLGHENINTTVNYYAAMEDEHKKEARDAVDYDRLRQDDLRRKKK